MKSLPPIHEPMSFMQYRLRSRILFISLIIVFLLSAGHAQVDRAALSGTVADPDERVLPGVVVVATQKATGLYRQTITSSQGAYDIPELPIGTYTVSFTYKGFRSSRFDDVVAEVGRTRTLNVKLQLAEAAEQLSVSAATQPLDQTSDSLGTEIEQKQVNELTLNGRNWATLTALAAGAIDTGGSNQRSIRFAGRGRDDNNFTYDGIDATNIINQAQQPYVRLAIPLDTIQEVKVDSMLATAELGGTGGGQMVVTSPSGTNIFHARVFEALRNNAFDARQPIDALNPRQPPFHLNQFGGSVGGPIVRDKVFFFASYEGYRQSLGQTLAGFVPSADLRAKVLAQSRVLAPIVNAYPEGQTPISPNVARFVVEGSQDVHEDSGMFRLDYRFSDKTTAFARANIDRALSDVPLASSGQFLNGQTESTSGPVNSAIELLHIFSSTLVNELKFGFNRSTAFTTNINQTGSLYAISVPGFTTLNSNRVGTGVGNSFSGIDNLTLLKGRHVLKAGFEIRRIQVNQGSTANGTIAYASADAFAANQVNSATLVAALPVNGLRKTQYFGYFQDEFKLRPNFTLNLGTRYSLFGIFHEVLGRANPFDFATCGSEGFCGVGASFGQPNYGDIDPRVAFAWAPGALGGKTVIRAGFGIYHEDGQLDDQNLPESNEVLRYSLSKKTTAGLAFPIDPFLVGTTGIISPRAEDRRRKDTSVNQWGASMQQALPSSFVGTLSYVGSKGTHLLTLSEVNVINPIMGTRPFPAFGQIDWRGNTNNSSFNGLSAALRRSFSQGLLLTVNYMYSHEIDDGSEGSGDGDSLVAQNVACLACERASGAFDARHVVSANSIYELPFGSRKSNLSTPGFVRSIFGSWELTLMVSAHTGFPVNVTTDRDASAVPDGNSRSQRANLVPGVSLTPPGGSTIEQWINPAAFAVPAAGIFGNAPRNIARAPGVWQVDAGLDRRISVSERVHLQFRAEVFNTFNHPQYAAPQADLSSGPGIFGSIISTVNTGPVGTGTPRQMQFLLRAEF